MRLRLGQLALAMLTALPPLAHAQATPPAPIPRPVLIIADTVWTGDGAPHPGWAVLVAQGRIQAVGPADKLAVPPGAERIDLPGKTVVRPTGAYDFRA